MSYMKMASQALVGRGQRISSYPMVTGGPDLQVTMWGLVNETDTHGLSDSGEMMIVGR